MKLYILSEINIFKVFSLLLKHRGLFCELKTHRNFFSTKVCVATLSFKVPNLEEYQFF